MEAKETNTDSFGNPTKVSEKWINITAGSMLDIFDKQLQFTTKFYDNFVNSFLVNTRTFTEQQNVSNVVTNSDLSMGPVASNNFENNSMPFFMSIDDVYKKMLGYNRYFLVYLKNADSRQVTWSNVNSEYMKVIEAQLRASEKIGNSVLEAYHKQLDSPFEAYNKLREKAYNQLSSLMKQNQKIMTDFFNAQKAPNISPTQANVEETKSKVEPC